jgi:hypothetical protein
MFCAALPGATPHERSQCWLCIALPELHLRDSYPSDRS